MGRYARPLAEAFVDEIAPARDARALDVGCGPGALTAALAHRIGAANVAAVDPSEPFATACAERVAGADVRVAPAERLPHDAATFDATLSQLVVNFLADAPAGVAEMKRVTKPGGVVAACVWDYAGGMTMLRAFWDAARAVDPERAAELDEGLRMSHSDPGALAALWSQSGLTAVRTSDIVVSVTYTGFDDFWEPFTAGVGPAGAYCASLGDETRAALEAECRRGLGSPDGPFELSARAWMVRGTA